MDSAFEYRLVQNSALSAELIWHSVAAHAEESELKIGVPFVSSFLILPIVFHHRSATALASKQRPGALYKALAEDRTMPLGLQRRLEAMADQTLDALRLGFDSGLLLLNSSQDLTILPGRKTPPCAHYSEQVRLLVGAAKRLGQSFSELEFSKLCAILEVRF